jgi:hypothetical protein
MQLIRAQFPFERGVKEKKQNKVKTMETDKN